jgi:hypothetical protein
VASVRDIAASLCDESTLGRVLLLAAGLALGVAAIAVGCVAGSAAAIVLSTGGLAVSRRATSANGRTPGCS